jgi:oxygen-dependent protoporphyrinogen oxidase
LSWRGKLALLREPFCARAAADKDESVADFFRRRIGPEATRVFIDALVTGIHGGDAELLSMRSAFPRVWQMEQEAGSIIRGFRRAARQRKREALARGERKAPPQRMWSFEEGMGQLPEALGKKLGPALQCNTPVERLERDAEGYRLKFGNGSSANADAVVLACPSWRQAELLNDIDRELAGELAGIAYTPIVVVVLGYRMQDVPTAPDGFGFIAPQAQQRDLLGVQWCSSIFPGRAPPGFVLWRALCGGWNRREMIDWPDERIAQSVRQELRLAMGVEAAPVLQQFIRWPRAIPQYFVGHHERVARIEALAAKHPGLTVTGNALHGVAINDCTEQAVLIAERLVNDLSA